jgi:hypothetical protein
MGTELGRGGECQVQSLDRELQSKDVRRFSVGKGGFKETDLNEIMRKVQNVLAPLLGSNGAVTVNTTLSQKDLKILVESDLMVGAVLSLVRSALRALPGSGELSLSTAQVDFTYQSILDGNHYRYGACASLVIAERDIEGWCKLPEPTLTGRARNGKDFELSTAYNIIKQHHGSVRKERVAGHGTTIKVYLPLASPGDASQNTWSLPGPAWVTTCDP